ncbi:MAG: PRC-barrel domain-containing protein, partial [Parvibaculales bacterium]
FYHADLIGLCARTADGQSLGEIIGVHNFGAGDLLEITRYGEGHFVPFTKAHVPEIDMESGYVVLVIPDEKEDKK